MLRKISIIILYGSVSLQISCSSNQATNENSAVAGNSESLAAAPPPATSDYNGPAGVPSFIMTDIDNKVINSADLTGNLTIILFNPDCDHCQREAQAINGSKNLFKEKQIYFISVDELDAIRKFRNDFGLTENNFHFAQSDVELIVRALGPVSSVPSMFFYKNGKMTGQMEGEKTAAELAAKM